MNEAPIQDSSIADLLCFCLCFRFVLNQDNKFNIFQKDFNNEVMRIFREFPLSVKTLFNQIFKIVFVVFRIHFFVEPFQETF